MSNDRAVDELKVTKGHFFGVRNDFQNQTFQNQQSTQVVA